MAGLDVICIGAINYDYMFHCSEEDLIQKDSNVGSEHLSNPISDVENDITELVMKNKQYTTQIGGSAFITLKVAKHIFPDFRTAYVGVCGTPTRFDLQYGKTNQLTEELAHLDDRQWLFTTQDRFDAPYDKAIAKSIVRLYNHTRNCIKIAPCANNTLLDRIQEQEETTGLSFSGYLSQTRWIHLSSLSDFDQFEAIMRMSSRPRPSTRPFGSASTRASNIRPCTEIGWRPLLSHADYIFLNNSEKKNLGGNEKELRTLYRNLCAYFADAAPGCTLIVKHDDRHELITFQDGPLPHPHHPAQETVPLPAEQRHRRRRFLRGGFISGMLCDRLNSDISLPIQMACSPPRGGCSVLTTKIRISIFRNLHRNF